MRDMGKAMTRTGEASGEKRALIAAEAAIANPLIENASMKGTKGLLISITGGNDPTLYEWMRRQRAFAKNSIKVLTSSSAPLSTKVVRVSVVATGIDSALIRRSPADSESTSGRWPDCAAKAVGSSSERRSQCRRALPCPKCGRKSRLLSPRSPSKRRRGCRMLMSMRCLRKMKFRPNRARRRVASGEGRLRCRQRSPDYTAARLHFAGRAKPAPSKFRHSCAGMELKFYQRSHWWRAPAQFGIPRPEKLTKSAETRMMPITSITECHAAVAVTSVVTASAHKTTLMAKTRRCSSVTVASARPR
jgi:FtsZ family, C-terminal domain